MRTREYMVEATSLTGLHTRVHCASPAEELATVNGMRASGCRDIRTSAQWHVFVLGREIIVARLWVCRTHAVRPLPAGVWGVLRGAQTMRWRLAR